MKIIAKQLLFVSITVLFFWGCDKRDNNSITGPISYDNNEGLITAKTNSEGKVQINSTLENDGISYELEIDLTLQSDNGEPLEGLEFAYTQINEKILLSISDPENNFVPVLLYAHPDSLKGFIENDSNKLKIRSSVSSGMPILAIIGVIAKIPVAVSYIDIARGIYDMGTWYYQDIVDSNEEFTLYCKDLEEIGDLVNAQAGFLIGTGKLVVSLVKFTSSVYNPYIKYTAYDVVETFGKTIEEEAEDYIKSYLRERMIEIGFAALNELNEGKKFGLRVYFEDESSLKNLFAKIEIMDNEPQCLNYIPENIISHGYVEGVTPSSEEKFEERYYPVVQASWDGPGGDKQWLGINLGATRPPSYSMDESPLSAGWYFQFGKPQGHYNELRNSSDPDVRVPNREWDTSYDTDDGWSLEKDPCSLTLGDNWRIPTREEWGAFQEAPKEQGGLGDGTIYDAFESKLKLHSASRLSSTTGYLWPYDFDRGRYWSSNDDFNNRLGYYLLFYDEGSAYYSSDVKSIGLPIRCIKNS